MAAIVKLKKLIAPNFYETLQRFPVSVISCIGLFVLSLLDQHQLYRSTAATALFCSFFWFGIGRILSEVHGWNSRKELIFGVLATISASIILTTAVAYQVSGIFVLATLIALICTPYFFRKSDDFSFWLYNRKLWGGVLLSTLAAMLIWGGLAAALGSIKYLFSVPVPTQYFGYLFSFAVLLYAPLNTLANVPRQYDVAPEDCPDSKGVFFLLNWILAPLAILYFFILYAYGIKILILWEMPKGQVSYMVAGFGILGIVTYLIGWPLREQSRLLVRYLYKHFFTLLLPPTLLLAIAIYLRIDQYGLTEDRYMVVLLALWFTALGVLFTVRPSTPIKLIPGLLFIMLLLASFGPWGAAKLSEISQRHVLIEVLSRNNMYQDGKMVRRQSEISIEDEHKITSILSYFADRKVGRATYSVVPEFFGRNRQNASQIIKSYNLSYIQSRNNNYQKRENSLYRELRFDVQDRGAYYVVKGYDRLYPAFFLSAPEDQQEKLREFKSGQGHSDGKISFKKEGLFYVSDAGVEQKLDIAPFWTEMVPDMTSDKEDLARIEFYDQEKEFLLVITQATVRDYGNEDQRLQGVRGYLLVRERK